MITEHGLHPFASLTIIIVCLFFILSTGGQYFNTHKECVIVPLTEGNVINICVGKTQPIYHPYVLHAA